jgi:hypothetical protein
MSIYEQLAQDCGRWSQTQVKYEQESRAFIRTFGNAFKAYIGAPDTCDDFETGRPGPCVARVAVDQSDPTDPTYPKFEKPGTGDILGRDEEGFWVTGLKVTMQGPNPVPQMMAWFLIRFMLRPEGCEMFIWPEKNAFVLDVNTSATWSKAFDYMVRHIQEFAASKPWDAPKQMSIGFTTSA